MSELEGVAVDDLREWLENVTEKESAQLLMVALAHVEEGRDVGDLADLYGLDDGEVTEWIETANEESIVTAVAETEGVDVGELADTYGLSPRTILDWFRNLESEPIPDAAAVIARYSQRGSAPVVRQTSARVTYLDYEAIEANGWSVEDEDLFENASEEYRLNSEEYGRILVEPGETILEAAENRGLSWPYACRGGACANCAVLVKEGDVAMPGNHVLTDGQVNVMNARLTCVGVPVTDTVKIVTNVQQLEDFEDLRLPSPLGEGDTPPTT